jgi:hypothetical protein
MTNLQNAWHDLDTQAGNLPRPEDIGKPLAATFAGHHRHAILILDVGGIIRFAATRGLFGRADEDLVNVQLQSLVPSLPLRESTPGYNVAYVRLAHTDRAWHRHRAVCAGRDAFPVDVSARILPIGRSYALLAAIREVRSLDHASGGVGWRNVLRLDRPPGCA